MRNVVETSTLTSTNLVILNQKITGLVLESKQRPMAGLCDMPNVYHHDETEGTMYNGVLGFAVAKTTVFGVKWPLCSPSEI